MSLKYVAGALALVFTLNAQAEMVELDFDGSVVIPGGSSIATGTGLTGHAVLNMGAYSSASVTLESVGSDPVYAAYGITAIRHVEFASSVRNEMDLQVNGLRYVAIDPIVRVSEFVKRDGTVSSNTVYLESRAWTAAQGNTQVPMSLQLSNVQGGQTLSAYMLDGLSGFGSLGVGAKDASQGFVVPAGFTFHISQASVLALPVPEPGVAFLWGLGGVGLAAVRRRQVARLISRG
jgi:hypothetical protein